MQLDVFFLVFRLQVGHSISVEDVKEMDKKGDILRNLNLVQKDTVAVPSGGFGILRFHANNPGKNLVNVIFQLEEDRGFSGTEYTEACPVCFLLECFLVFLFICNLCKICCAISLLIVLFQTSIKDQFIN